MRILKWPLRLALVVLLAAVLTGVWKRDDFARLMAVNNLFSPDRIVTNFTHMNTAFLHQPIDRGAGPIVPLPGGPAARLPADLARFIAERKVTSLVVLKSGALVHEGYHLGTSADDLHISWSVAKSYLSALTGILLAEGVIGSLDDQVVDYAPQLRGGAYDGATIRNVLHMMTGVTFGEDVTDKSSDINRMGRVLALGGEMDAFAAGLTDRFTIPGTEWQYVSIDSHVLGMVLRGATDRSVIDLMGEKIITPLGVEQAPYYLTDGSGVAFVLGGFNGTARDYARFGQMILQRECWNGQQIVPEDWVIASTTPSAPTGPDQYGYGYQWWMPRDARPREFIGRGIYGQYLYINEEQDVVIMLTAADPQFGDKAVQRQNIEMLRSITDGL